ncbi:MAG: AAA family ATPase [Thermoanaerobaculia bacterium]
MKPVIRSLTLKGFRSFALERVQFDNPTFLVGQNGSGKTNLASAFSFLAAAMSFPLQEVVKSRGGFSAVCHKTPNPNLTAGFGLAIEFAEINGEVKGGRYAFQVRGLSDYSFDVVREQCIVELGEGKTFYFDRHESESYDYGFRSTSPTSETTIMRPLLDPASLVLPTIGGDPRLTPILRTLAAMRVYSIEPSRLRDLQDPDRGFGLQWDGGNAASVLQQLARTSPSVVDRISELLTGVLPHKVSVRPLQLGQKLTLEFKQEWGENQAVMFDASSMSDGTLRVLGILLAVFQETAPSLTLIEEPEATVHPGTLSLISDLLKIASDKTQVIVTTHSPELLDAKWIEDRHLRVVEWKEGESHVSGIATGARRALQEHLMGAGELFRSSALDSPPLPRDTQEPSLFEDVD